MFAAVAGRAMDGGALYAHLNAERGESRLRRGRRWLQRTTRRSMPRAKLFLAWFDRQFLQPPPGGRRRLDTGEAGVSVRGVGAADQPPRRSTSPTSTIRDDSTGTASTSTARGARSMPVPGSDVTGLPPDAPAP